MPPATEAVIIRSSANGYELELQNPRGLSPSGLPVWIQLGGLQLRSGRESPTVGEYGLVFSLSREQFAALPEGAEVVLLSSASGRGRALGRLDKSALRIR